MTRKTDAKGLGPGQDRKEVDAEQPSHLRCPPDNIQLCEDRKVPRRPIHAILHSLSHRDNKPHEDFTDAQPRVESFSPSTLLAGL